MANYLMIVNYHYHPVLSQGETWGLRCMVGHFSARGAYTAWLSAPKHGLSPNLKKVAGYY